MPGLTFSRGARWRRNLVFGRGRPDGLVIAAGKLLLKSGA
jgi:hypothetical protein